MARSTRSKGRVTRKQFGLGFWIWWERSDGSRGGPSQIWMLALSKRLRWAYVEFKGAGIWVCEHRITEVVPGSGQPRRPIESQRNGDDPDPS